jgi:cytochrome c
MALPEHEDAADDPHVRRPLWIAWAIALVALAIALGMVNLAWLMLSGRLGPTEKEGAGQTPALDAARQGNAVLPPPASAGASMRCHGVERQFVGPAFVRIAERYRGRADAQSYLADKIVNGSVGAWGRVIMPRQVGVSDATAQQLAAWIVQLAPLQQPPIDNTARPPGE